MIHKTEYRVYYEDTDAGGIMYHGQYIAWCERARLDFMLHQGLSCQALADEGILLVVRHLNADYFKSAKLEQTLRVETSIRHLKNTSFVMNQSIFCQDSMLFSMAVTLVCINSDGKPVRIPDPIRSRFLDYQE
jgi:acyl-CoA thioester hydrolase